MIQGQTGKKRGVGSRMRAPAALACSMLLPVLLTFGPACSGAQERVDGVDAKARAEYDLGREAFEGGRLREALGHAQASIRIDETNPDAHYLATVILLAFCAADETSTDCRFEEAERHARAALESAPELRDAKNALGVIL